MAHKILKVSEYYTGDYCPNCTRCRLLTYTTNHGDKVVCEKCNWCVDDNDYFDEDTSEVGNPYDWFSRNAIKKEDASEADNPHDIISEMANDFSKKVIMDFQETEEKFIFTSIRPFINSITDLEISKEELVRAISLIRLQKEASIRYGAMISNDWNTAVRQVHELRNAYDKGFQDAIKKEDAVESCDFCSDFSPKDHENHIEKDKDGNFDICADTGDPYEWGYIEKIRYCPYCGKELKDE